MGWDALATKNCLCTFRGLSGARRQRWTAGGLGTGDGAGIEEVEVRQREAEAEGVEGLGHPPGELQPILGGGGEENVRNPA